MIHVFFSCCTVYKKSKKLCRDFYATHCPDACRCLFLIKYSPYSNEIIHIYSSPFLQVSLLLAYGWHLNDAHVLMLLHVFFFLQNLSCPVVFSIVYGFVFV